MQRDILIIRLSSLGDIMHCTPVARSLKNAWPDCHITWLVGKTGADLIRYNPHVDEVMIWPREEFDQSLKEKKWPAAWALWQDLRQALKKRSFYAALDLQGLFLTGLIMREVKAERQIGLRETRELNSWFMSELAAPAGPSIEDRYLSVLRSLEIRVLDRRPTLVISAQNYEWAREFLAGKGVLSGDKLVVFILGTTWPSKNWPIHFFCEAIKLLTCDFKVLLCGGKAELVLAEQVRQAVGDKVITAVNQTSLLDLAGILARATVVVGGDTGPLYMAAALAVPNLILFGPTDPAVYGDFGEKSFSLVHRLACSFCHKRRCPLHDGLCMKKIEPAEVVAEIYRIAAMKNKPGT